MTSEDKVRPFHSRSAGSGQEAADAVAAVLKHAAEHDKAAREKQKARKQPRWMLPLGINLAVFALYLLIAPPSWRGWVTVHPIEAPPAQQQVDGLRVAMYLQAQRIEAYRQTHGALPPSLADAGSPTPGVEYHREGGNYQLVGTSGPAALVYDSSESLVDFGGAAVNRLSGG